MWMYSSGSKFRFSIKGVRNCAFLGGTPFVNYRHMRCVNVPKMAK